MANYLRPGVYVEESLLPNNAINGPSTSVAAFVGANNRGPSSPTRVESWTQYLNAFGGFNGTSELPHALFQYFANGGRVAFVVRALGAGATKATRTLNDRAATPLGTLKLDALNEGAWGNSLYVSVSDGATGRFNLTIKSGGTGSDKIVETFSDLTMVSTDSRYAVKIINSLTGGSLYVKATDLASGTAVPNNNPAVQSDAVFATGADGAAPTSSEIVTAVQKLDEVDSPLNLNLPGVYDASTLNQAISYASGRGDVFFVADGPAGQTVSAAVTFAQSLTQSSYAALYFPHVVVADPSSNTRGATRVQAPGPAALGQFAQTDAVRGVFKAPAGVNNRLAGALGLERALTNAELDTLNNSQVNAVRNLPGVGVCLFGARTLKAGFSDKYLPIRRTLIYLKRALLDGTRFAIFEPNDAVLWDTLRANIDQFLRGFWAEGGLRGNAPGDAYYVKCDADNNTFSSIAAGVVNVEVGVALQYPAEFVVIKIGQVEAGGTATEG